MRAWPVLLLVIPALTGCFGLFGDAESKREVEPVDVGRDPTSVRVSSVTREAFTVTSFDGTALAAIAYVPFGELPAEPGRPQEPADWPVVLFVHGWGGSKENYEGTYRGNTAPPELPPNPAMQAEPNHLEDFAKAGFIAVAYDARGFGESGGDTAVAGPNEVKDLEAVRQHVEDNYADNGLFGVTGQSYGGGHSFLAWARNPNIQTAVPHYGWIDLYDALLPGNVPKLAWSEFLYVYGLPGARGDYNPMIHDWYQRLYTREDLPGLEEEMDERSMRSRLPGVTKPLFACQGMQESLFPQLDEAWAAAGAFVRSYVFTGGHGKDDPECWALTLDWFRFFLAGYDTGVDSWPALRTQDAAGTGEVSYPTFPRSEWTTYHLRAPDLVRGEANPATFTITQDFVANPFVEPGAAWDQMGLPYQPVPAQLREDPGGTFFETPVLEESAVLLGAPVLELVLADAAPVFQVTGILFAEKDGDSRILSRGAVATLGASAAGDTASMRFHWVKADLAAGERLVLKLAANDSSWFMPMPADYAATFTGASSLELPFFEG